ncbi:MAG: hypothetical protein IJT73_09775, partial [Selenomonadaceae bacterium]|nr:hypothetical protein [Selenomonadaceae bacterium]
NSENKNLHEQIENLNAQIGSLHEQIENLNAQNKNLHEQIDTLDDRLENANAQIETANEYIGDLTAENIRLNGIINEVFDSNSWKVTEPLRTVGRWLRSDHKDKALSVAKLFYKAMPLNEESKTKLKDKFYKSFSPILKNTLHYKIWLESQNLQEFKNSQRIISVDNTQNRFVEMLETPPGKIAIHAHIFYLDLAQEIANYFSNMPYKFDALISIIDPTAEETIKNIFGKVPNVESLIVRVVPNRGRDVAPFICGFGDILPNYDFVCHVHSKKSLYTGSEQTKWRHYLFDALLGSSERIKKIFFVFKKNKNLGLIYPKPAENVPYAAFTWLSNKPVGMYLLKKIGVPPSKTDYFDFPAGTMFWVRAKCLRKFYNNLSIEDFPAELGQNDGTIAHAFERAVALTVNSYNKDFLEFDPELETYTVNIGNKNMWQYYGRSDIELQWVLDHGEIISFDIFDTLLMRRVAVPYLVNELIQFKVEDLLGKSFDFPKFRLKAEEVARQQKNSDVTLDDIYKSFADLTELDEKTCKKIRALEVKTEIELALPREEVVSWFNRILQQGRKIWLISDMYLQTPDLEKILRKCGIKGYEKLLISCETGMRKDTAEIWNDLVQKGFTNGKLVHLGDNEMSDVQFPGDRIINAYHIMSAINLFSQVPFGRMFLNSLDRKMSLYAGMMFGTILAEKFHSPFQLRNLGDGGGKLILRNYRELGYWLYGSPILTFMLWLIKKSAEDDIKQILFLARDGYFLQPLYKFITKLLNVDELPNDYFYASRRAVTVASIHEISQTEGLFTLRFEGTVKKFFEVRFGIEVNDETELNLPNEEQADYIKKIIAERAEEILSRAEDERQNYETYIKSLGKPFENVGVVDMGYSGTIQFYLQKVLQKELTGYYFATSATNLFGEDAFKKMHGCFTENDDYGKTKSAVYKYQLLFEAILTAPDPQLQYFDATGKPIFGAPEPAQFQIENIREVHEGIKDFCRDVITSFGEYLLRTEIDFNFVDAWVRSFVHDENIIAPEIRKIFAFDDKYCNTFTGNALDLYLDGGA